MFEITKVQKLEETIRELQDAIKKQKDGYVSLQRKMDLIKGLLFEAKDRKELPQSLCDMLEMM